MAGRLSAAEKPACGARSGLYFDETGKKVYFPPALGLSHNLIIPAGDLNLANTPQAEKCARQAEKHRKHNQHFRSMMRTYIKKTVNAIQAGDQTKAQAALRSATPVIDSMVTKGLVHKNKAARHKSRLSAQIRAMATAAA